MEQAVTACKSFVIAAALLAGRISVREAFLTSRVEEEAQVSSRVADVTHHCWWWCAGCGFGVLPVAVYDDCIALSAVLSPGTSHPAAMMVVLAQPPSGLCATTVMWAVHDCPCIPAVAQLIA